MDTEYFEWVDDQIQNDWEYHLENQESGGGPIKEVAKELEDYVDQEIVIHSGYHQRLKKSSAWTVEPDSSIKGAEVVSPVFSNLDEAFANMNKIFKMIDYSFETDETTGLHVNIGTFTDEELKNLDLLKFLLIVGGENLLKDFDRKYNEYTTDNMDKIYDYLRNENLSDYKKTIAQINDNIIKYSKKMNLFNFTKLTTFKYIEVRGFGNAGYEKKGEKIENYVRKILRALDIAMDPNAYKETYLKYLAKAITMSNPNMFLKSDNRALDNYKAQYEKLINRPLDLNIGYFEKSIVTSYEKIVSSILDEQEYDMVTKAFYNTLSTFHSVMKNNDNGDYRKNLSKLIQKYKPIISEYKNLSSKKDRSNEENNRLELIQPVAKILSILVK